MVKISCLQRELEKVCLLSHGRRQCYRYSYEVAWHRLPLGPKKEQGSESIRWFLPEQGSRNILLRTNSGRKTMPGPFRIIRTSLIKDYPGSSPGHVMWMNKTVDASS